MCLRITNVDIKVMEARKKSSQSSKKEREREREAEREKMSPWMDVMTDKEFEISLQV